MDPDEIEMMGRTDMAADNKPDIMNDPAYDTNVKGKQNSMDEADTCRICRGEGSPGEALFYPCKCSGSIKFVHQNCLMEWLSHSQKKHCELCKTHFHFTKLYHPHMPTTVPLPIFIRQAAVHIWKSFLTWTRFQLVLFVWVAWLPWCMRAIWRGLFWIGDGAWVDWKGKSLQHNNSTVIDLSDKLATGDTTPINQTAFLSREALAAAFITKIATKLPDLVSPIQRVFSFANDEPLGIRLFKKAYHYSFDNDSGMIPSSMSAAENITRQSAQVARSASLLSEFKILKNLTRSNMLNKLVIDALEGQLITLLLVTTFILIFLIREWVVQQQPNFNGGAEPDADPPGLQNAEVPAPLPADQALQIPQAEEVVEGLDAGQQVQGPRARIIARARPRRPLHPRQIPARGGPQNDETAGEPSERSEDGAGNSVPTPLSQVKASTTSSSEQSHVLSRQRPAMPDRDTLAGAAEIRRTIEEQSRVSADRDELVAVFKDIWNRAGRKPSEVLRIIEDEERGEELSWIVATMKKIRDNPSVYPAADLPLDPEAQSGVPLLSNSDDEIFNSRQPSDDEGFVVLDKPSLSRGQEAKVNRDITEEDARLQSRAQLSQHPERSSSLLHSRNTANSNRIKLGDFSSDPETDFVAPVAEPDQAETSSETNADEHDSPPEASKGEINDFAITDRPRDASLENPFLPAYAGELPARNSNHGSPRLYNDVLGSSRTEQADSSPVASSEGDLASLVLDESSRHARPIAERITDWLWGGVAMPPTPQEQPVGGDDEHVVNDIANEAPFVPIDRGLPLIDAENDRGLQEQDPQVVAAAMQAGLDPNGVEAADDIEDLEGVMELVGMQGPLAGLIQNGMFCACLVSLTIFFGVWIPYMSGKLFLVILAHPVSILVKLPFRWAASTADMAIDIVLFATACTLYWTDTLIRVFCVPFGWIMPPVGRFSQSLLVADFAKSYAEGALERLANMFIATGSTIVENDVPTFSVVAHESLNFIEERATWLLQCAYTQVSQGFEAVSDKSSFGEGMMLLAFNIANIAKIQLDSVTRRIFAIMSSTSSLWHFNPLRVNLSISPRTVPLDYDLAYWGAKDRALAIIFGYLFFALVGVIYLNVNAWFRGINRAAGKVGGGVADVLHQAGGVLKVILIISIEMIAFPLYCGLLLDVALLPLFSNATLMSRIEFTLTSPYTSIFVHWFVGTCYMFHFALFVAMCRKLMRTGVLYFIRDPDDPTFHPVRDVLERSVSTQLWKISFSALVYGGLVIVCLGGVVWGIAHAFDDVLPFHWSSNEPVLEFPVELLFYNFLMPLAVKFFKPSKGLNMIYNWWFRKCARALRLTHFLFGERKEDEEGRHVRRTWADVVHGEQGDIKTPVIGTDRQALAQDRDIAAYFLRDGRYVRAPASDQVRIPKGAQTFLEVDQDNNRIDDQPDFDDGLHGRNSEMFSIIYIPPLFRLRISAFIFLIWLFAATTGVSITIVPLVLGRYIFAKLTLSHLRMNDIYAFSIGIYLLGGAVYGILYRQRIRTYLRDTFTPHTLTITSFLRKAASFTVRFLGFIYTYAAFGILLPTLLSLFMEFYLIIPLHTYFSTSFSIFNAISSERHIIHLIQDWTLGVLYLKMAARIILYNTPSRPASALRGIVRDGWLKPDFGLATRGFILPGTLAMAFALTAPLALGWLANTTVLHSYSAEDAVFRACVYRYSYPGVLALGFASAFAIVLSRAFAGWRKKVRDEVYLIGERLHNFGEGKKKAVNNGKGKRVARRPAA